MVNHLNHLNLTKGKISKLYKKKKQTLKKKKNGKHGKRSGRSYRKKRHLNLANKTMKNMQHGGGEGGFLDWFTGKKNTSEGESQPLNNQPSSTVKPGFLSSLMRTKTPATNEYQPPVMNPLLQPNDIQEANEKQEKMNQVIQELREKLKRDNKLQDSPDYENADDEVSNLPFEEEPTDKSVMNPIHSTEYGQENPIPLTQEEKPLTSSTEYGEIIPETPEENLSPRIEYNQVTPEEVPMVNEESKPSCEYLNKIEIPQSHCLDEKEYKKLALKLHPDKNLACSQEANKKFQELNNQKCSNQEEEEEVPVPQEYHEVTPEEVPVPQEEEEIPVPQEEEEIPVPQKEEEVPVPRPEEEENLNSSTEYGEIIPETPEEKHPVPLPVASPVSKDIIEEDTATPTESSLTDTFDQEVSRMPSSISNSFQNIIDYLSNQIVGKLSGYSSGGSDELQNGFIANNLNNRSLGVGGQKSPLRPPPCKTRRSKKKSKISKGTRKV